MVGTHQIKPRLAGRCHMADPNELAYHELMALRVELDTKVSPEGRVVIPIEVRRALEVAGGGRVRFVLEDGQVSVVSSRTLAVALWANNHGNAGDSVADVRTARNQDRELEAQNQSRAASDLRSSASDQRSDDEVAADLLAAVGLVG
jgi:AbrB family looped-hinge helix DNA binding protein